MTVTVLGLDQILIWILEEEWDVLLLSKLEEELEKELKEEPEDELEEELEEPEEALLLSSAACTQTVHKAR